MFSPVINCDQTTVTNQPEKVVWRNFQALTNLRKAMALAGHYCAHADYIPRGSLSNVAHNFVHQRSLLRSREVCSPCSCLVQRRINSYTEQT